MTILTRVTNNNQISNFEKLKHGLRGGYIKKIKGMVASCAPESGSQNLVSNIALAGIIVLGAAVMPTAVSAQQFWDGAGPAGDNVVDGGTATWNAGNTNWTNAAGSTTSTYNPGTAIVFSGTAGTVTVSGGQAGADMDFQTSGYTVTGDQIQLQSVRTINVGAGDTATINAPLTIDGGINKTGAGTLILGGNNTFPGGIDVQAGTVRANTNTAFGSGAITGAGTFDFATGLTVGNSITAPAAGATTFNQTGGTATLSGNISGATSLGVNYFVKTGTGTLVLSGNNTTTGGGRVQVNAGTLQVTGGNAIGDNNVVTAFNAGTAVDFQADETIGGFNGTAGTFQLNANTVTLAGAGITVGNSANIIGAGNLNFSGGGQQFTTATGYTGSTTLSGGDLDLNGAGALASTNIIINNAASDLTTDGGGLAAGAGVNISAGNFTANGAESISTLTVSGGTVGGTGTLTVTTAAANAISFSGGAISADLAGAAGLTKSGVGTGILTGANTYTGTTAVSAGTLNITGAGSIASTAVNITGGTLNVDGGALAAGATVTNTAPGNFQVDTGTETITSLNGTGGVAIINNGSLNLTGDSNIDGVVSGNGNLAFNGGVSSLDNAGNTISGPITIAGATVTASVAGALGATTGSLNVSGGTLDLGTASHTKGLLVQSGGNIDNGTLTLSNGLFGRTGGGGSATINAPIAVTAIGGTIPTLATTGISATNATAAGITMASNGMAPAINNAAGDGINFNNSTGGNVAITLGSDVQGSDDGIDVTSTGGGTVTIDGSGNVTGGNAVGNDGIVVSSDGNTTVTVTGNIQGDPAIVLNTGAGNILVNGVGDVVGALQAMDLDTTTGNITVTQDASGGPSGILGGTIGIDANSTASGIINIGGAGTIRGTANEGVLARTTAGTIFVDQNGAIRGGTTGVDAQTTGGGFVTVRAQQAAITGDTAAGVITRTTTGINTVNGGFAISGVTFGIDAQATAAGGSVTIDGTGATSASGVGSTAINAQVTAGNGAVRVSRSGAVSNTGTGAANGINATNVGTGNVDVDSGTVALSAASTGTGINAVSTGGGNVTVDNAGAINGGAIGINASSTGAGTVTVTLGGPIGHTVAPTADGIRTSAATGATNITGAFNVSAGDDGVEAGATGGIISVTGLGNITAGTGLFNFGVLASSGGGNVTISSNGNISGGRGIGGNSGGGDLSIQGNGTISGLNAGIGHGITYDSANGTINIGTVTANGNITGGGTTGDGIEVNSGTGATNIGMAATASTIIGADDGIFSTTTSGNITILRTGAITGTAGDGIRATSTGGNIQIGSAATGIGNVTGGVQGIEAETAGAGTINIDVAGTVTGATEGILATAVNGNVDIETAGNIIAGTIGVDANHTGSGNTNIDVTGGSVDAVQQAVTANTTGGGTVNINIAAGVTVDDTTGNTVETAATSGDTTVLNFATLESTTASAISSTATTGDVTITNNASGTLLGMPTAITGVSGGGQFDITNAGTIGVDGMNRGLVNVTGSNVAAPGVAPTSLFTNSGNWFAEGGASTFSGALNNTGTGVIDLTGSGTSSLNIDGDATNAGAINMADGDLLDSVTIGGNYAGGGSISVDANLTNAAGGAANGEQFTINGAAGGANTTVNFQFAPGTGVLFGTDIPIIAGGTGGSFTAAPIASSGFVDYNFVDNGTDFAIQASLSSAAGLALGAVPSAISAANVAFTTPARATISGSTREYEPGELGYAVWTRVIGGRFEADSTGTATNGAVGGGTFALDNTTETTFGGFQAGFDVARFDLGENSDVSGYLGLTAGRLAGETSNIASSVKFSMPFVGVYSRFKKNNFTFDAMVRRDFQTIDTVITSGGSQVVNAETGGKGWSALIQANYDVELNGFDVKTSVDLFYSRIELDDIPVIGTTDVISVDPFETIIGKSVVNISKGVLSEDQKFGYRPFVEFGVQHDFADAISSTISGTNAIAGEVDNFGTQFIVGGGVGIAHLENDWVLAAKGEVKFGEKLNGVTGNLVFRKNF